MEALNYIIALAAGYLLGSIQIAVILSRVMHRDDVRMHGSGNAGSTNMIRVYGVKAGIITFAADLLKGMLGAFIGLKLGGLYVGCVMAFGVVLGHNFPVFFGFKGGKGVAASFGIILVITPLIGGITVVLGLIAAAVSRTISLASLTGATLYVILTLSLSDDRLLWVFAFALSSMLVIRHRENIKRLVRGEEGKLFNKKTKPEGAEK